jgi:hypothetical protein
VNRKTDLIDRVGSSQERTSTSLVQEAQALIKLDRSQTFASLNALFRSGKVPEPSLDGRYRGELIALDIAPVMTAFFQWLTSIWMPWRGKTFRLSRQSGDNIFTKDSYPLARLFNPLYRCFVDDSPETYRGFAFHTYAAPGLVDTDRTVLKIDYNLKENPSLIVRRVLDELVQVQDNFYLGKAHIRWWSGRWQTVAFFSLSRE